MDTGESASSALCNSLQSFLIIELSASTVTPLTDNKVAFIELLPQSSTGNPATAHTDHIHQQELSNSTAPHYETPSEDNPSGETLHVAAITSTNIPANLRTPLTTYLQQASEIHQHQTTEGAGQALIDDLLSEASELQHSVR